MFFFLPKPYLSDFSIGWALFTFHIMISCKTVDQCSFNVTYHWLTGDPRLQGHPGQLFVHIFPSLGWAAAKVTPPPQCPGSTLVCWSTSACRPRTAPPPFWHTLDSSHSLAPALSLYILQRLRDTQPDALLCSLGIGRSNLQVRH